MYNTFSLFVNRLTPFVKRQYDLLRVARAKSRVLGIQRKVFYGQVAVTGKLTNPLVALPFLFPEAVSANIKMIYNYCELSLSKIGNSQVYVAVIVKTVNTWNIKLWYLYGSLLFFWKLQPQFHCIRAPRAPWKRFWHRLRAVGFWSFNSSRDRKVFRCASVFSRRTHAILSLVQILLSIVSFGCCNV